MNKPKLKLVGEDGNAFVILGRAGKAARSAGWDKKQIEDFTNKAMGGDYNHLLRTVMEHFDVEGSVVEEEDEDIWDDEDDEGCWDCGETYCDGQCLDEEDEDVL